MAKYSLDDVQKELQKYRTKGTDTTNVSHALNNINYLSPTEREAAFATVISHCNSIAERADSASRTVATLFLEYAMVMLKQHAKTGIGNGMREQLEACGHRIAANWGITVTSRQLEESFFWRVHGGIRDELVATVTSLDSYIAPSVPVRDSRAAAGAESRVIAAGGRPALDNASIGGDGRGSRGSYSTPSSIHTATTEHLRKGSGSPTSAIEGGPSHTPPLSPRAAGRVG